MRSICKGERSRIRKYSAVLKQNCIAFRFLPISSESDYQLLNPLTFLPPSEMKGVGGLSWLEYDPKHDTLYLMKMGSELYQLRR